MPGTSLMHVTGPDMWIQDNRAIVHGMRPETEWI